MADEESSKYSGIIKFLSSELFLISVAGLFLAFSLISEHLTDLPERYSIIAALLSLLFTAVPIVLGAVKGLLRRETNVAELVSLALVAAVLLGEYIVAAEVAFILSLGEMLEDYIAGRSRRNIEAIADRHPTHAFVMRDSQYVEVPLTEVVVGDQVLVRPGDIVPVDGIVLSGESGIDESGLTGESIPVEKATKDEVYTGTLNLDGALQVEARKVGENSTYGRIVELIKEAEEQRVPPRPMADHFIAWYTPIILAIVAVVWAVTGDIYRAMTVLIVACPCALLLSTPSAIIAALAGAAKSGVLVKSGIYLESCGDLSMVAFDKTGTLTSGTPVVQRVLPFDGYSRLEVLGIAAEAESASEHPVAKAIVGAASREGVKVEFNGHMNNYAGLGIEAISNGESVAVGGIRYSERAGIAIPEGAQSAYEACITDGLRPVFVYKGRNILGLIGIEDMIRPESHDVVSSLRDLDVDSVAMLTGDSEVAAMRVAADCGIPEEMVHAELLPDQKLEWLRRYQKTGRQVCYVGDGTNDGPALVQADLGVSIGSRENTVALETAQVVFMRGGLEYLPYLIGLGRHTKQTINVNLLFAVSFSFAMIILAATGIISPALGAFAHIAGSVGVVLNSSRLAVIR